MDNNKEIMECIKPILDSFNVELYELKWINEKKNKILQIAIMNSEGLMDIDTCALVSEKISEALDAQELIDQVYYLEVCSPGAERVLRNLDEVLKVVGKHIYVKLKHPVKNMQEITGDLLSVENNVLTVQYRDKAATRKVSFEYDEIELIRLAVKF